MDSLFSADEIREKNGSANQSKASVRVSTKAWHDNDSRIARAVESISENGGAFSKIDKSFSKF